MLFPGCNYKGGLTADHKAEARERQNWQRGGVGGHTEKAETDH